MKYIVNIYSTDNSLSVWVDGTAAEVYEFALVGTFRLLAEAVKENPKLKLDISARLNYHMEKLYASS